jgi:ParB family transcriptional regulator, chromosome partitioning protein
MQFFSETIELGRVDSADTTYQISTQKSVEDLKASIRRGGLLSPPLLRSVDAGRLIIVSGFRRISACRELGWDRIDARIVSSAVNDLDCCRLAIADNTNNRVLNTIEQSVAISKLSLFFDDDQILSREVQKSGLHVNPELVKKLKKLTTLYSELLDPIISGVLSLTIALELGNLDRDAALMFLHLFETLKPTLNHQKEMLTMAREISMAGHVPIFQLIKEVIGTDMLDDRNLDRPQKIQTIRDQLQRLRYPEMVRFEKTFQERLQRLNLPESIRLIPPVNFEGTNFTLSFTFQNINQFKSGNEFLCRLANNPDFKKILDKDVEDNPPVR